MAIHLSEGTDSASPAGLEPNLDPPTLSTNTPTWNINPQPLKPMSIRLRLTLWYIVLLTSTLIFFGVVLYGIVRYSFYSEVDRTLQVRASQVEEALLFVTKAREDAIREGKSHKIEEPPFDLYSDVYIELRMPNGGLSYRTTNLNDRELPLTTEMLERASLGEQYVLETELNHGEPIKLLSQPVFYKGQFWAVVLVGRSLGEISNNLQKLLISIATGIGLALIAALVVGAWLAERALTPVDAVTQAALRISRAEDLTRRLPPYQSMDEIGRLIAAFNEMLGRLDDVFRDQQRFVADVSHELRTPLTALQGNIDLLKRGGLKEPQLAQDSLKIIESEVARLSRLVSDLLLLARADGGEKLVSQPVELDTLLLEVFVQGQILIHSSKKPIRLRLGHEDQATILGAPDRIKQLLLNLVDNAIKYTPEGEIVLSLWKDEAKNQVHISVQDTGIGISSEALPHLFRRFYRADKARSRKLGGTGLGLAIVHWIVQAHKGQISVVSEEGQGSTFTVILPLPTAQEITQNKALPSPHTNLRAIGAVSWTEPQAQNGSQTLLSTKL